MATLALFDDMLNEHLAYDLLKEELFRRNFLLEKVQKNTKWKGGTLPVPFKGARASSYKAGGLTAENDVADDEYVRGEVSDYKEIWGTIKFHAKDLHQHVPEKARKKGMINADSFMESLPDRLEDFIDGMKDTVSVMLLNGAHVCKLTADATAATGEVTVDRIDRLTLGQKVIIDDDDTTAITAYVRSINVNTDTAVLYDARTGGSAIDFTTQTMTIAQNAKLYIDGADTSSNAFTSLRDQLLSAANGGSANLFGKSKLAYPYLQATNISGSSMTASTVLSSVFDAWTRVLQLGRGQANDVIMSFKHLGSVMKELETNAGPFRHVDTHVNAFGYTSIKVQGVRGVLTLTGVQEMDDDVMYILDWKALKLHSNGFFERQVDLNGNGSYTVRATTGYTYFVDIRFYGELIVHAPSRCGVIHGISY